MVEEEDIKAIEEDFRFLKDKILALLLFGSRAIKKQHKKSDFDICVIKPDDQGIIKEIFRKIDVVRRKYDVYLFEELPLYMKMEVINNHKIIFSKNIYDLYEYFYFYRKLWKDQERRNKITREDILKML